MDLRELLKGTSFEGISDVELLSWARTRTESLIEQIGPGADLQRMVIDMPVHPNAVERTAVQSVHHVETAQDDPDEIDHEPEIEFIEDDEPEPEPPRVAAPPSKPPPAPPRPVQTQAQTQGLFPAAARREVITLENRVSAGGEESGTAAVGDYSSADEPSEPEGLEAAADTPVQDRGTDNQDDVSTADADVASESGDASATSNTDATEVEEAVETGDTDDAGEADDNAAQANPEVKILNGGRKGKPGFGSQMGFAIDDILSVALVEGVAPEDSWKLPMELQDTSGFQQLNAPAQGAPNGADSESSTSGSSYRIERPPTGPFSSLAFLQDDDDV